MNRLKVLPIKFREIPKLEMLDLTYNNFTEETVGTHFWDAGTPLSKVCTNLKFIRWNFNFLFRRYEYFTYPTTIFIFFRWKSSILKNSKFCHLEITTFYTFLRNFICSKASTSYIYRYHEVTVVTWITSSVDEFLRKNFKKLVLINRFYLIY